MYGTQQLSEFLKTEVEKRNGKILLESPVA
jgi:hypothetical protein